MTAPSSNLPPRVLRILRWKQWIITNTLIVAAAAVVISLVIPEWYLSKTTVFPPERETGVAPVLGSDSDDRLSMSLMSSLIGAGSYEMPLFASPSDIMRRILGSRTLGERIIEKHDLLTRYKVDRMDDALKILKARMKVFVGREGVVTVTMLDTDPQLAADLANDAIRIMDDIQREQRHSVAGTAREFIQRRLADTRVRLAAAEDSLLAFQKRTGIVAPESQTEAFVESVAELTGRRMALEVQLETLREISGPEHPRVARLESDIRVLNEALAKLGAGPGGTASEGGRSGSGESLGSFSDLMLEYQRLLREVRVQETLQEYLVTRHEYYRIEEVRDTPTVQVLDEARPAEKKTKPIRWLICVVSTLLAFGVSLVFFHELERLRESAVSGGLLSQVVERLGGAFIVRRLRSASSAQD